MVTTRSQKAIAAPLGFPIERYIEKLNHPGLQTADGRRAVCRTNPLSWALTYFPHHLRSSETGGIVSLSEFHIASAEAARQWMRNDLGPAELRRAWVASRGAGKSSWWNLILPLWALAYGHRDFIVAFGHTSTMARRHLLSLRAELTKNRRLREDFPELCEPAKNGRRSVMDTQDGYQAASGAAIVVAGLDQGTLGIKLENRRPDLLIIDDGEPPEGNYSDLQRDQRLQVLREAVFPMSLNAAVELVGTTTRMHSIMHDALRGATWAVEENIVPHHFPALVVDEMTGEERSSWPARWSLNYLRSRSHTRDFAVNYQCEPVSADGTHWQASDFIYDESGVLAAGVTAKVLAIDPAVTSRKTSDQTGIAVVGWVQGRRCALVERAGGVRYDPARLRAMVHRTLKNDPSIRHVIAEVTNGGEYIEQALSPLPNGLKLITTRPTDSKLARITSLFDLYQRGEVVHAKQLPALESQQCGFPHGMDDIVDSVETAVRWLRERYR